MDHAYDITINSKAIIGKNVTMYKGSTIGCDAKGVPVLGDLVYVGLNATIVANSFVNFNVPSNSVVLGNPGQIHFKENSTKGYLLNIVR